LDVPRFAFIRGRVVPYAEATVGILMHTLNYGTGVFGGMRGYWNENEEQLFIFRPFDHLRRFLQSAKLIGIDLPQSVESMTDSLLQLLHADNYREDCYIRPFAYFSNESIAPQLTTLTPDFSLVALPFTTPIKSQGGMHVTFSSWRRLDDNMIPARGKISGAYVNSHLAKLDASHSGFDDALLLNTDGHVAEGSVANFFMVRDDVVITPPVTDNILEGVTRRSVIALLRDELHCRIEERPIDRSEVLIAEEAFLCGTATEIAPIVRVDSRTLGSGVTGPVTSALQALYGDIVRGTTDKYRPWRFPVGSSGPRAKQSASVQNAASGQTRS
jgi:branched-chain amino acid aminotransferase